MTDQEIIEEREYLRNLIKQKEIEWDNYSKTYAGVPEYWEVQKNAFNEIQALRNQLNQLPGARSNIKSVSIASLIVIAIFVIVSLIVRYFYSELSVWTVEAWINWAIFTASFSCAASIIIIFRVRYTDGEFNFMPGLYIFLFSILFLGLLKSVNCMF